MSGWTGSRGCIGGRLEIVVMTRYSLANLLQKESTMKICSLLVFALLFFAQQTSAQPLVHQAQPGGRITAQSGIPVPTSDQTAITTLFYAPYDGRPPYVPVYNGVSIASVQFTASISDAVGLSLALNTSAQTSGNLYDIYVGNNSGLQLCTGPAWSNSGAGTSARGAAADIALVLGIQVNNVQITCSFAASSFVCPAKQCTRLGTVYATANGQTALQFRPASASGGANPIIGFCNAYNQIAVRSVQHDSTGWTYAGTTIRDANNSANNRIRYIDCNGDIRPMFMYSITGTSAGATTAFFAGICFNIGCTTSGVFSNSGAGQFNNWFGSNTSAVAGPGFGIYSPDPVLGLNFGQAGEVATSGTITFFGAGSMGLSLDTRM